MYSICVVVFAAMQSYVVDIKTHLQRKRRRKKNKATQESEAVVCVFRACCVKLVSAHNCHVYAIIQDTYVLHTHNALFYSTCVLDHFIS